MRACVRACVCVCVFQSVNNKEQCSVPDIMHGLGGKEEGLSIDVYQTAEHFDLLPFSGQA